jgi:hypothetical protein
MTDEDLQLNADRAALSLIETVWMLMYFEEEELRQMCEACRKEEEQKPVTPAL